MGILIRVTALILSLTLANQTLAQQGNARGRIGESPYNVVSGWAEPFQEPGFADNGSQGNSAQSKIGIQGPHLDDLGRGNGNFLAAFLWLQDFDFRR